MGASVGGGRSSSPVIDFEEGGPGNKSSRGKVLSRCPARVDIYWIWEIEADGVLLSAIRRLDLAFQSAKWFSKAGSRVENLTTAFSIFPKQGERPLLVLRPP